MNSKKKKKINTHTHTYTKKLLENNEKLKIVGNKKIAKQKKKQKNKKNLMKVSSEIYLEELCSNLSL